MASDSIEGIYDTLKQCALISKSAGGIGLNVHCIRSTGSYIAGVSCSKLVRSYFKYKDHIKLYVELINVVKSACTFENYLTNI